MPGSHKKAGPAASTSGASLPAPTSKVEVRGAAGGEANGGTVDSKENGSKRLEVVNSYLLGRSRVCLGFDCEMVQSSSGQLHVGMIIDIKQDLRDGSFLILMVPELPPGSSVPDTLKQMVLRADGTLDVSGYIKTASGTRIRAFPHEDEQAAREELEWLDDTFAELRGRSAEPIPLPAFLQPYQGREF